MKTASIVAIAKTPAFRSASGDAPASSRPAVTHEPTISASLPTWPSGSSGATSAAARIGTTRTAIHGRAPCAAQPSAIAQPGGTSTRASHVSTSALAAAREIAATVAMTDSGATSDQPRPPNRDSSAGSPAAGSATQRAWAASSTAVSGSKYTVHSVASVERPAVTSLPRGIEGQSRRAAGGRGRRGRPATRVRGARLLVRPQGVCVPDVPGVEHLARGRGPGHRRRPTRPDRASVVWVPLGRAGAERGAALPRDPPPRKRRARQPAGVPRVRARLGREQHAPRHRDAIPGGHGDLLAQRRSTLGPQTPRS